MKNIQVIDEAPNCVYDIFALNENDFDLLFPNGQDVEFIEDLELRIPQDKLKNILERLWQNPIPKIAVQGIHGILFYNLYDKKKFYPDKKDSSACNPDGSALRRQI